MNTERNLPDADSRWMARCYELASIAKSSGDAAVGSVLVYDGESAGEGIERVKAGNDVTAHAEIEAIRAACMALETTDLSGSVLYTNVAPCPMCAYAIRLARVSLVVSDLPEPGGERSITGHKVLTAPDAVPNRGTVRVLYGGR